MQFRKKPVVIEARPFHGDQPHEDVALARWCGGELRLVRAADGQSLAPSIAIRTLEGEMLASPGDWIIRGVKGEFYPCKPDIFAATYDLVSEAAPRSTSEPRAPGDATEPILFCSMCLANNDAGPRTGVSATRCINCGSSVISIPRHAADSVLVSVVLRRAAQVVAREIAAKHHEEPVVTDTRTFRVLRDQSRVPAAERDLWPASLPWSVVEPWRAQAERNHGQTLERLNERGGLAPEELWAAAHGLGLRELGRITESAAGEWLRTLVTAEPRRSAPGEVPPP